MASTSRGEEPSLFRWLHPSPPEGICSYVTSMGIMANSLSGS